MKATIKEGSVVCRVDKRFIPQNRTLKFTRSEIFILKIDKDLDELFFEYNGGQFMTNIDAVEVQKS